MMRDTSVAVGVEIGGQRTTVALVDAFGQVHHRLYARTLWGRPAMATLQPCLRAIDTALAQARAEGVRVRGIGVCVPGTLDRTLRRPLVIPTLPTLSGFPLCDLLEARYQLPIQLHVDVEAAVLGEYCFGAGQGFQRPLFLTVNAVVGAAMVVDGMVARSGQQYVGHVCHIPVATSGPRCSCGKRGCINTLVSLEALQKMVQRALRRGEETNLIQRLSNRESFSPQLLAEEAARGDSVALWIYNEVGRWLGTAASKYISLFAPDILILGGSVLPASELLLSQVRAALATQAPVQASNIVQLVPAQLGSDASLVGAVTSLFSNDAAQDIMRSVQLADVAPDTDAQIEALRPPRRAGHTRRKPDHERARLVAEHAFAPYPYHDSATQTDADVEEPRDGLHSTWLTDQWLGGRPQDTI
ncbi:MAG: ROK family protein [Chloroflexota bacterium]|nr:ROK family protein [Chloroflexota bacterium]